MSENNSENGNENEMLNDMTMVKQITDVQVKVVELIATMVKEGIQENWNAFIAGGFDVKAHVESAFKELTDDDENKIDVESIIGIIDDYDMTDQVQDVIGNYDFSDVVNDNTDWSDAADSISDYIDWDDRIRNNIDICDVASDVADNLDISDMVQNSIQDWVSNGCNAVDEVAVGLYDRAMRAKGNDTDGDTVVLSREEYDRIMEVVNFIRPVAPLPKTSRDMADDLVASVAPTEAMTLVQSAIVAKATADAQALVAATNGVDDATK